MRDDDFMSYVGYQLYGGGNDLNFHPSSDLKSTISALEKTGAALKKEIEAAERKQKNRLSSNGKTNQQYGSWYPPSYDDPIGDVYSDGDFNEEYVEESKQEKISRLLQRVAIISDSLGQSLDDAIIEALTMYTSTRSKAATRQKETKTVGEKIREARTLKRMSQQTLAQEVGLSWEDIGKAERGEKKLTQAQLKAIAKAVGVTQASLLAKDDKVK